MIFLIDQDGPLAGFDAAFFAMCEYAGWEMDCTVDTQVHRFATKHMKNKKEEKLARAIVNSEGWFEHLPVVEGAKEGLEELAAHPDVSDVWIVTKPLESNETCRDEKAAWIRRHFGKEWERKLILTPNKALVKGTVLLDDAPYMEWLPNAEWRAVLFQTPYNGLESEWGSLPKWKWEDGIEDLLDLA